MLIKKKDANENELKTCALEKSLLQKNRKMLAHSPA